MGKFTRGVSFADTAPDNALTAARLHALLEDAEPTTGFITELPEITSLESTDCFPVYDASGNVLGKVQYGNTTSSPVGISTFRNLTITNNGASPTTTVDITADEVVMRDSSGLLRRAASVSLTANITASGAGGRDTGAEAASTWYYIWIISDGSTQSALLSTSSTAPTMPSGYDYKVRVGGVYNNSASDFWVFVQNDNDYAMVRQVQTLSTNFSTANNDPTSSTGYNTVNLNGSAGAPFIPGTAYRVRGNLGKTSATNCNLIISANTAGIGAVTIACTDVGTSVDSFLTSGFFEVPVVSSSQQVSLKSSITANGTVRIAVTGFKFRP